MRFSLGGLRFSSAVAFALALLLVIAAALAAQLNLQRLRNTFGWVEHTDQILLQVATIDTDLVSAVAALQADLLAGGNPDELAAYRQVRADLAARFDLLRQLVSDNPSQVARIDALRSHVETELDRLEAAIGPNAAAQDRTGFASSDTQEQQARAAISDALRRFREAEVGLLTMRQRQADWDTTTSTAFAVATVVLAIAAAALGVFLLERERERSRRRELQVELLHVSRLNTVGQTASMLAHEVNQPLTAARNFLSAGQRMLGAESVQIERVADAVQRSLTQVDRATEIIRHLRRFVSRSEPGRTTELMEAVIAEAIEVSALEQGGAVIAQRIDAGLPLASIDKVQIQQVLVNLMRNALEAMGTSERREVTISARGRGRGSIQISVQDTGPGLPKDVAAKLFQPFVTTKEGGMGVGLSICRRIVEAHDGRIWAEAGPAGGTVFHFTIPVAAEQNRVAADRAETAGSTDVTDAARVAGVC